LTALREFTSNTSTDVAAITECNAAWDNVEAHLHPIEQMRYWWECTQWNIIHNRQENFKEDYQPGRMGLIILNQLAHRAQRPGDDKIGLGKWCYTYESCQHTGLAKLMVHSQPISNKYNTGPNSDRISVPGIVC